MAKIKVRVTDPQRPSKPVKVKKKIAPGTSGSIEIETSKGQKPKVKKSR